MAQHSQTPKSEPFTSEATHSLDYEIADVVYVEDNSQMKAVADDTRKDILNLLLDRAATQSQLADVLERPKGTVGYHVKVLEEAGLVRVVRTGKVRAMTEKYYGRTGLTIEFRVSRETDDPMWFVTDALRDIRVVEGEPLPMFTTRVARIPVESAVEFADRVAALAEEFIALPRSGDTVFGLLAGVYPTGHPALPDEGTKE